VSRAILAGSLQGEGVVAMTVISTFLGQVKPGRLEDAVALTAQAAKPLEAHGARNIRLFRGMTGENYGALAVSLEFESNEAWGKANDALMTDDELVSLMARSEGANSPYLTQTVMSATEIPIGGPKGHGPVLGAISSRSAPGQMQAAIEVSTRGAEILGRHGANGCRLLWINNGGTQTGLLILLSEFASNAAFGKASDGFFGDAEGVALLGSVYGPDSPVTIVSQDLYAEITL